MPNRRMNLVAGPLRSCSSTPTKTTSLPAHFFATCRDDRRLARAGRAVRLPEVEDDHLAAERREADRARRRRRAGARTGTPGRSAGCRPCARAPSGCAPPCRRGARAVRARPRRLRSGRRDASDDEHRRPDLARGRRATPRRGPACGCSRGRRSSRSSSARRCRGSRRPGAESPIQRVPSGLFGPGRHGREALPPRSRSVGGYHHGFDLLHDDVEPAGRRRVDRLAGRDREVAPDLVVGAEEP